MHKPKTDRNGGFQAFSNGSSASLFAGYEQAGTFYCDVKVGGEHSEEVLFGAKLRYIGATRANTSNHLSLFHQANHHFGYATVSCSLKTTDL